MKNIEKQNNTKRSYQKPLIERIALDHEISMVMLSGEPPLDPLGSTQPDHFSLNPFKM